MPDPNFTPVKHCSKCLETKPISEFFKAPGCKDGLRGECKSCTRVAQEAYQAANKEKISAKKAEYAKANAKKINAQSKAWYESNKEEALKKQAIYYLENKSVVNKRNNSYRAANAEKVKESRAANAHKHKDAERAWRDANQDHIKAYRVAYWEENKEKLTAESVIYREKNGDELRRKEREKYKETYDPDKTWAKLNPERNRETAAAWRAANPELKIIWEHNRRARKLASGGKLSKGLTEKLFKLQKGKCACCKAPLGDDFNMDHIMPLFLGGSNTDDNIQLLRAECNKKKSSKHPVDYMQSRGFLL